MIGMSFISFVILLIISVVVSAVLHYGLKYYVTAADPRPGQQAVMLLALVAECERPRRVSRTAERAFVSPGIAA